MQETSKSIPRCMSVQISKPSIGYLIPAQVGCGSTQESAKIVILTSPSSMNANPKPSNSITSNLTFITVAPTFMDMAHMTEFVSFQENASMISLWSR